MTLQVVKVSVPSAWARVIAEPNDDKAGDVSKQWFAVVAVGCILAHSRHIGPKRSIYRATNRVRLQRLGWQVCDASKQCFAVVAVGCIVAHSRPSGPKRSIQRATKRVRLQPLGWQACDDFCTRTANPPLLRSPGSVGCLGGVYSCKIMHSKNNMKK